MTRTLNSHSRRAIIILTRYPEPGAVKTRLVPALGPERAARLHGRMIEHTAYTVSMVAAGLSASCYLFFTGGSARLMKEWLGESFFYHEQEGESLGDRMHNAFSHVFKAGATEVVLTGTDCPELDAAVLTDAFSCMTSHDVVIGPAEDVGTILQGSGTRPAPAFSRTYPGARPQFLSRLSTPHAMQGFQSVILQD